MIQIEILDAEVQVKSGTSSRTGKPYNIREQKAAVHGVGRYPAEFRLPLPDDVQSYKPGLYDVTTPFGVGRYGLIVSRDLGLTPARKAA